MQAPLTALDSRTGHKSGWRRHNRKKCKSCKKLRCRAATMLSATARRGLLKWLREAISSAKMLKISSGLGCCWEAETATRTCCLCRVAQQPWPRLRAFCFCGLRLSCSLSTLSCLAVFRVFIHFTGYSMSPRGVRRSVNEYKSLCEAPRSNYRLQLTSDKQLLSEQLINMGCTLKENAWITGSDRAGRAPRQFRHCK